MPTPLREPPPKTQSITIDQNKTCTPRSLSLHFAGSIGRQGYRDVSQPGEKKLNADNQRTPFHGRIHDHTYWHKRVWSRYRRSPRGGGRAPTAAIEFLYRHHLSLASSKNRNRRKIATISNRKVRNCKLLRVMRKNHLKITEKTDIKLQKIAAFSWGGDRTSAFPRSQIAAFLGR